ncbi:MULTISPECIES: hypothetical protein [unclassified Bacillus (in: firmicutes)]|uniref:hypothetical protein n=2 Tax=Bacillus TaxID=1386 RepID=UPI0013EEE3DE|nr:MULTISPECIES: hypothetical protein [unclassified Bacillus (in: firmicutes)]KAF6546264.1 hypothetical protein G9F51_12850 [Bacillus sp. EKM207B]KAF6547357.1 hypothetical protein G9F50_11520 [Bacillus sp. EKM206B]MBL3615114.1 hypothetical protein [Bacillus sp. RHFS18]
MAPKWQPTEGLNPIQDLSNIDEFLIKNAVGLVKDEVFWYYQKDINQFKVISDLHSVEKTHSFKILANVGLEYLIKAVCIKLKINIFKAYKSDTRENSINSIFKITASNNEWLQSIFNRLSYRYLGDINTITLNKCIHKLKDKLLQSNSHKDLAVEMFIRRLEFVRKYHRNLETHIVINLTDTGMYEKELPDLYNTLLNLFYDNKFNLS